MGKSVYEYHFDSPELFTRAIETRPIKSGDCSRVMGSEQQPSSTRWCDLPSVKASVSKAKTGDPEAAKRIKPRDVELTHHGAMNTITYDYAGDNVDVGRYLSGEPEHMASLRRKGKPIINILVNITVAHYISRDVIIARGKAIMEIMSGLEANGYGVDITIVNTVAGYGLEMHKVTVKIKDSKEYFNLPSLAYWLISPSVFRRLWFRFCEQEEYTIQDKLGSSYGRVMDVPQQVLDTMPDCVYFPYVSGNDTGQYTKAIQQIMETYKP